MYQIDYNKPAHLYFIGIGGVSMSGFAELLHTFGFAVSGSDLRKSETTIRLENLGIKILYGHDAANITKDYDLVVYSAAISSDNPEFIAAREQNIPMMTRAEMVGQVMKNYEAAIAVSGTHGKSTTTSMISKIFIEAGTDPTVTVGAYLKDIQGNLRIGKSEYFIMEACEYTNSFLQFYPTVGIILNVEEDHLDFFKDIDDIRRSFHLFAKRIPKHGLLVMNAEIERYPEIASDLNCPVVTFGIHKKEADYSADNVTYDETGRAGFDLFVKGRFSGRFELGVPGLQNVSNALSAIATAYHYHLDPEKVKKGLSSFTGANRRFEVKGVRNGVTIIDDYAHHPTEIEVTLQSAGRYPHNNVWCVFQPHTYTRTKAFSKEIAAALSLADKIVLTDIYAAREKNPGGVSSEMIRKELLEHGKECHYIKSFDEIKNFLINNCINGDLLITMGAGDVVTIGESLLSG